jgi:prepilin-type N-terminal cleavage/methylation domain-containing protein
MQPTNSRQSKTEKAFTLIELLLVVAIVGILAGLAVVNMSGATEAARIAKIKVFSNSIRNSLMGNRVSEWRFDETSGTATADTAGINTGALANFNFDSTSSGWRIGSSCVSGGCLQFDGVNDSVSFGAPAILNPGLGSWTVGGWVFAEDYTYPKSRFPIGGYLSSGSNWYIDASYNSNGTVIGFSDGTNRVTGSLNCDAGYRPNDTKNKWTHIYVIFDRVAGKAYEYVNGVKQSNTVDISSVTGSVTNPYDYISGVAGWMLDGFVDDVCVYNAALTASRVKENYLAGLDRLLAKGQITQQDYQQRLADLNSTYATNE